MNCKKSLIIIILILTTFFSSRRVMAAEPIFTYVSGNSGFLVVNRQPLLRLDGGFQGISVERRIKLVEERLHKLAATGFTRELLKVTERQNKIGLTYRDEWLVTADPQTAYQHRLSQRDLALLWRENIIDAFKLLTTDFKVVDVFTGTASWYGAEFRGRSTANGELFDETKYTAAHRKLAFGTKVRVTNLANGLAVIVTINDRGPWVKGRVLDLSWATARAIQVKGVAQVKIEVLEEKAGNG